MPVHLPPEHSRFVAGESGNPGGKPVGARNRLTAAFLNALAADFDEHGRKAISECRESNVAAYIKAIAALCPKEVEFKSPLQELEDAELLTAVRALEGFLAARGTAERAEEAAERKLSS
jgi:hypothetical protein